MSKFTKYLANEDETAAMGALLAQSIFAGAVVYLQGDLGAGKTTLVRGFLRQYGYMGKVKSPTYTLVEDYEIHGKQIVHFDFYRLASPVALYDIGIDEYFIAENIAFIEWPEKGLPLLPQPDFILSFTIAHEGRNLVITALTPRGKKVIENMQAKTK